MTLSQLRTFALVARLGSLRAAAQELGISEPAVSAALAALRTDLGDALVVRSGSGIALTPGGRALAGYAQEIVGLAEQSRREVARAAQDGAELRILATPAFAEHAAGRLLEAYARRHPGPAARVVVDAADDAGALLGERAYDIALGIRPARSSTPLHALPFLRYRRILVAAANHPLAALPPPRVPGKALTQRWFSGPSAGGPLEEQRWFANLPAVPELVQLDSEAAALAAVRAGEGLMLAVAHVIRHDLASGGLVQLGFPGTPVSGMWWASTLLPGRVPAAADALLRFAGSAEATEAMMAAGGPRGLVRRGTQVHVALWSSRVSGKG
ncbi:LysR family transcriptional regulator [Arthrobacter jiangjiafuii]|uniref:LysR family transcriptional regulator n=1 Tax=Arthrobacter jiangjiafuii TaxID=2817475 RepID=A0A975M7F9_9MICC|nr:LysR family transcriptional regulator [Arthrobacter jiangjiafuii]MBP3044419.1 LysR family transcriptional regulator [Arthrobacter jiangjiafuii]QWC11363.1 LysR family transcriptional regulator [Arthrobacter jiangjiafuii]